MDRDTATPRVDDLPGDRAREWVDHHHRRAAPSTYVYEFVWDTSAEAIGPFCTDVDGNVLMDFSGHVGAAPLGYNNPKVLEPMREFDLVDPMKIAGQDFYVAAGDDPGDPGPTGLMDRLADACTHYDMDTVFLSNSGAEAVENAIKICYDHTGGKYAITCEGAFHGRTLGALSLNRSKEIYRRRFPEIAGVHETPFCQDRTCDAATCSCGFFFDDTSRLRRMLDPDRGYVNDDEMAFLILEPIQGEGGYNVPSEAFMREVADVCAEHDLLLVADEIQSGLGRTGEMWASDHYPIEPDVVAAAKGLRVGATVSRAEIFPDRRARLSSTWGAGDVLAAIQGSLTLDAIREYDLVANAAERGRHAVEALRDADLPNAVDVRGKGLMLAVEFDTQDRRDAVVQAAFQRGLLTLGCGYRTLRLLPPLDVTEREIDLGVSLLAEAAAAAA
ncbi:MAG: aspartate aminotransferase family protein [Haloarculaceae archaeon]